MYHFIRVVKNICTALILLLHVYTAWRSTDLADHLVFCLKTNSCYLYYSNIIFPHMVSAETIFFLNLEIQRSQYIKVQKLFKGRPENMNLGKLLKKHIFAWKQNVEHVWLSLSCLNKLNLFE